MAASASVQDFSAASATETVLAVMGASAKAALAPSRGSVRRWLALLLRRRFEKLYFAPIASAGSARAVRWNVRLRLPLMMAHVSALAAVRERSASPAGEVVEETRRAYRHVSAKVEASPFDEETRQTMAIVVFSIFNMARPFLRQQKPGELRSRAVIDRSALRGEDVNKLFPLALYLGAMLYAVDHPEIVRSPEALREIADGALRGVDTLTRVLAAFRSDSDASGSPS